MAEERNVVEYQARDGQQIKLTPEIIKKFLVSGKADLVTMQEMYYYMGVCKSRGMNPFIKDCYLVKYTERDAAAIITSIDYYRKRAKARDDCQGWKAGVIVQGKDGQIKYSSGLVLEGEKILGGWFEALPKGWTEPFRKEVNLKGYIKRTSEGKITRFWSEENQPAQIAKVAEAQGLRTIWGDEFQGLYVDAEMQSAQAQGEFDQIFGDALVPATPEAGAIPIASVEELEAKVKDVAAGLAWDQVKVFIEKMAETNKVTYEKALVESLRDTKKFLQFFKAWGKQQEKREPGRPKKVANPEPEKQIVASEPSTKKTPDPGIVDFGDEAGDEQHQDQEPPPEPAAEQPQESEFLKDCRNYFDALTDHNLTLICRHFGVLNKHPEEIDKELPEEAKVKFLEQCKRGLAKQNG